MAATREDIEQWFEEGKELGATHMIVVCNEYDWEDYPVFVMPDENAKEKALKYHRVMEVYSLSQNMESQLNERRAFYFD